MATGEDLLAKIFIAVFGALVALFLKEQLESKRMWATLDSWLKRSGRGLLRCEAQLIENLDHVKTLQGVVDQGSEPTSKQVNDVISAWHFSSPSARFATMDAVFDEGRMAFLIAYLDYWTQLEGRQALYRETLDALLLDLDSEPSRNRLRRQELASRLVDEARGLLVVVRKIRVLGGRAIGGQYSPLSDAESTKIEDGARPEDLL